jgi:hypothetical protein
MYPDLRNKLLSAALKAGSITWKYGLLCKGNSLCHGIAGNGYLLHCLFRTFQALALKAKGEA